MSSLAPGPASTAISGGPFDSAPSTQSPAASFNPTYSSSTTTTAAAMSYPPQTTDYTQSYTDDRTAAGPSSNNPGFASKGRVQPPPPVFSIKAPVQSFTNIRNQKGRTWKLVISYGLDWLITIGLTAGFFLLDGISGYKREFDLTDTSIQHTFAVHERIPNWGLIVISAAAPLLLLPLINLATVRSWWDWHTSSLGLVLSLGLTGTITNVIKICVGRPRPDLIDRCQPLPGSVNAPVYGLSNWTICTQTDNYILNDGFRSFPSGHSSLSFAGLGFLSLYLTGKLHLFDERGYTGRAWLAVGPLVGAALTAVSRTMDNRHHWQDVTTGSILGIIIAFFSYRQFYPPLSSPRSHKPYSPRIKREPKPPLPVFHTHHREDSESHPLTATGGGEVQYRDQFDGSDLGHGRGLGAEGVQRSFTAPATAYEEHMEMQPQTSGGGGVAPKTVPRDPYDSEDDDSIDLHPNRMSVTPKTR